MDVPEGHLADLLPCLEDLQALLDGGQQHEQSRAGVPWKVVELVVWVTVEPYTKAA